MGKYKDEIETNNAKIDELTELVKTKQAGGGGGKMYIHKFTLTFSTDPNTRRVQGNLISSSDEPLTASSYQDFVDKCIPTYVLLTSATMFALTSMRIDGNTLVYEYIDESNYETVNSVDLTTQSVTVTDSVFEL